MLKEQDRPSDCRGSLVVSEGRQGKLTPCANSCIDNFPEGNDDDDDWEFDGAIGGEPLQSVGWN